MEKQVDTLQFDDLSYDVPNLNPNLSGDFAKIIESLSGKIESGKLTAILGVSGCGKTHLLQMLVGDIYEKSKTSGQILYNGKERNPKEWRKIIGYVPQDDIYYPNLSVYDQMKFYGSLNNTRSSKDTDEKIDEILKSFAIFYKKHSIMDSLSGGERKRAVIAISMVSDPKVIVLDEPTTGLDSNTALEIIYMLRKYAHENNCMVIASVHQPGEGLFSYFDDLIILVQYGVFYMGPYSDIKSFLTDHGLIIQNNLSLPEFIFMLLSEHSHLPEIEEYKTIVAQIIENNRKKDNLPVTTTACNNYKDLDWSCNNHDISKIFSHCFKLTYEAPGSIMSVLWALVLSMLFTLEISLPFLLNRISGIDIVEDYKTCSLYEIFRLSCAIYYDLTLFSYLFSYINTYTGLWSYNPLFIIEYFLGKYTFGTYFASMFFSVLGRYTFMYLTQFIIWCFVYKNILLHPLIFCFVLMCVILNICICTSISLLCEFSSALAYLLFITVSGALYIKINDSGMIMKNNKAVYLFIFCPTYLFRLFLKTKCFDLASDFQNKPSLIDLLSAMKSELGFVSFDEGAKGQIIYEYLGQWSDLIVILAIILSCILLFNILIIFYNKSRIYNMRLKLTK